MWSYISLRSLSRMRVPIQAVDELLDVGRRPLDDGHADHDDAQPDRRCRAFAVDAASTAKPMMSGCANCVPARDDHADEGDDGLLLVHASRYGQTRLTTSAS